MIPAGAIRKRAIIRQFLEAGAVSEETARTPEEAGVFQGLGIKFDQLVERGVDYSSVSSSSIPSIGRIF